MAAFDTPWLDLMSPSPAPSSRDDESVYQAHDQLPTTTAAFSPVSLSHATSANRHRSTILVHQKSPLLIATPPQITRALAYSHAFLLPLNKFVGLLTWTTNDSWESFILVAFFWAIVLYGDIILRFAGPVVVVLGLILGMYSRRYSPLSSTGVTGEKQKRGHKRENSEVTNVKHQKSLDEIVETLKEFTARCNMLLDPLIQLTDFLSTQRTATSATTRPALTTLFIRIILITPLWLLLTLPPLRIITTKRIALTTGTLIITWHSKPTRVSREILWRSAFIRRVCSAITGLQFATRNAAPNLPPRDHGSKPRLPGQKSNDYHEEASLAASAANKRRPNASGVKFTFIIYENQRRWVGLGWTTSLFAYERSNWTDEHLNPAPSKAEFELPDVEGGTARWRWVKGSKWLVEGAGIDDEGGTNATSEAKSGGHGWIYYDNKWQNGRRGQDGWGKYTRRRKWYRDAELVEVTASTEITPCSTPPPELETEIESKSLRSRSGTVSSVKSGKPPSELTLDDSSSTKSAGFRPGSLKRTSTTGKGSVDLDEGEALPGQLPHRERDGDWGIGDEVKMGLE
ncbi:hypothetical protein O988_01515 [Pseudogymnoascus sp. VKM F-3808]|nr:hypothetical protein O988_01515 [Pseudogymnoascus sp. VKM F-3808]